MIWKTTNALGQEVVWYSDDEYNKLKEKGIELSPEQLELLIEKIKGGCYSNKSVEKS